MSKRSALGSGINSLFSSNNDSDEPMRRSAHTTGVDTQISNVTKVPITHLHPNPMQPRKFFDDHHLEELAQSIHQVGILQPILVKKMEEANNYLIISGERRWRAAQKAGIQEVPVIFYDFDDLKLLEAAIIENIQRQDLNVIEEAQAYQTLIEKFNLSQEQVSQKVGKDRTTVSNTLRLLKLDPIFLDDLINERISMGHARALLSLNQRSEQIYVRDQIVNKDLNVRQTEDLIREVKKNGIKSPSSNNSGHLKPNNANLQYVSDSLQKFFGTKVRIIDKEKKGYIQINYTNFDDLERILHIINPQDQ